MDSNEQPLLVWAHCRHTIRNSLVCRRFWNCINRCALKLLTSSDEIVRNLAWKDLTSTVAHRLRTSTRQNSTPPQLTLNLPAAYLSGKPFKGSKIPILQFLLKHDKHLTASGCYGSLMLISQSPFHDGGQPSQIALKFSDLFEIAFVLFIPHSLKNISIRVKPFTVFPSQRCPHSITGLVISSVLRTGGGSIKPD